MTRAHPPLHLSVRALAWAAAAALAGAACNSDDREQFPGSTSGTTEVDPTMVPEFTTAEPMETTMDEPPPPSPVTCRKAIFCAVQCAINIPNPTPPEYNWQACFFEDTCLASLNHVEWLKLFELMECVVGVCSADPACMDGGDSDMCNVCYIQKLSATDPPTPECVEQANACK